MATGAGVRTRVRDSRSRDILAAFTRNVARSGYAGSNFSEIARELDISKGTIVHHYGTKDQLFAQMHDSYMERRLVEAHDIVARFRSPGQRLAGLLFAFLLYQEVDREATVAFQREIATLATHEALTHGRELRAEYLSVVRSVLADGMESSVFRSLDVDLQSLLIFGSSQWAWTWFQPDERLSALEAGGQLVQLVLGSLLVDRAPLDGLADPAGEVATAVAKIVTDCSRSHTDQP
ncbi:TetR family transcriptional regulator [Nocardia sp. R6R-6]|uniref:TetR family transcriptional regulator n=1 Tax=Nocardia sp. R6R-6 TaxID=3459303 RepID=UPI00403E2CDF